MVQKTLFPKKITRNDIISLVDKAADIIRTATDYKFILVLLFLKRRRRSSCSTWMKPRLKKRRKTKYITPST